MPHRGQCSVEMHSTLERDLGFRVEDLARMQDTIARYKRQLNITEQQRSTAVISSQKWMYEASQWKGIYLTTIQKLSEMDWPDDAPVQIKEVEAMYLRMMGGQPKESGNG